MKDIADSDCADIKESDGAENMTLESKNSSDACEENSAEFQDEHTFDKSGAAIPKSTRNCKIGGSGLTVLLFGQVLSFLTAAAGAAQATLKLDCHLSAPALSVTPLYFFLTLGLFPLYRMSWKHQREIFTHKKTDVREGKRSRTESDDTTSHTGEGDQNFLINGEKAASNNHSPDIWSRGGDTSSPSYSLFGLIPLSQPVYIYALAALADFYANYFTVMAFRYTTITSVAVTDALAIPAAMALSRCWLGRRYSLVHFLGVALCMVGIVINVFQDYETDHELKKEEQEQPELAVDDLYPHKTLGDFLGITGGVLFGVSNTFAEHLVRDASSTPSIANLEYLSLLGFFAGICCIISIVLFERDRIRDFAFFMGSDDADEICSTGKAFGLWMGYSATVIILYVGTARFLQKSEAVYYNLSILTGDFWSVGFSLVAEKIAPLPGFYPALILIIAGNLVYEMTPSPVSLQARLQPGEFPDHPTVAPFHEEIELPEREEESSVVSRASANAASSAAWV